MAGGDTGKCPLYPDCTVRIKTLENYMEDTKNQTKIWEEQLSLKVGQKLFFWVMGLCVLVIMAVFGVIYKQGADTLDKIQSTREAAIKVEVRQEILLETLSSLIRGDTQGKKIERETKPSANP